MRNVKDMTDRLNKALSTDIPYQLASLDIWEKKYRLADKDGTPVDETMDDTFKRVAKALAANEKDQEYWYAEFLRALRHGCTPAGRIMSNAGALAYKPSTSTINCTVSGTIEDSMDSILEKVHESGLTLKSGSGIGYDFSTLRPKGAFVSGAGAYTSGPLSFMDIYDKMCFTVSSAGGRRGAQMGTFDVSHPDVMEFIRAKRESGRLRQFNLSLLITDAFMTAVIEDKDWDLIFPAKKKELDELQAQGAKIVYREWPYIHPSYVVNDKGEVACKVYNTIRAKRLWDMIMSSTYDYAEPGFILIDRYNDLNNNWYCENIRATNPCAEQGLPPYGSCLLGSLNLTRYVINPFQEDVSFDWEGFSQDVAVFTRMLDNVVEINGLALQQQRDEITRKRRHGMGYLGLGSALVMMQIPYGSKQAIEFTEQVTEKLAVTGWITGVELAKEKGSAPIMDEQFTIDATMMRKRPELAKDGFAVGDQVPGRILMARYSRYLQMLPAFIREDIERYGCRFTHHSSIAPTGTIALSLGNNASNGIEPSFAHAYMRNVIVPGKKTKEQVPVYSYELLAYRTLVNPNASVDAVNEEDRLPDYFITADSIDIRAHIDMQAAAQKFIDSSISKTCNVATDYPYEKFKDIYLYAYQQGMKGCTTYRFNPEVTQGVLVKTEDLENTKYEFKLEDGTVVELNGNDKVEYDGDVTTAANLYDALRDGLFGKF